VSRTNVCLVHDLKQEADGIFNWLLEGAYLYNKVGALPKDPEIVEEAVQEYRESNDVLATFIRERLERNAKLTLGQSVLFSDVFSSYNDWQASNPTASYFGEREFTTKMDARLRSHEENRKGKSLSLLAADGRKAW
jgi:phage/plasmid-associated DNA primase